VSGLTPGQVYIIAVGNEGQQDNAPAGNFILDLSTSCEGPPTEPITASDSCAGGQNISFLINGPLGEASNANATPATGPDPELPSGSPSCHWNSSPGQTHNTVWFRVVAPANGALTMGTCNSQGPFNDSIMALYSGNCGSLTEIGCGEDDCPTPGEPPYYSRIIRTGLTPGQTYHIMVGNPGGWGGSTPGTFRLSITSP
jgi:hypothetical protein